LGRSCVRKVRLSDSEKNSVRLLIQKLRSELVQNSWVIEREEYHHLFAFKAVVLLPNSDDVSVREVIVWDDYAKSFVLMSKGTRLPVAIHLLSSNEIMLYPGGLKRVGSNALEKLVNQNKQKQTEFIHFENQSDKSARKEGLLISWNNKKPDLDFHFHTNEGILEEKDGIYQVEITNKGELYGIVLYSTISGVNDFNFTGALTTDLGSLDEFFTRGGLCKGSDRRN
jgi:hypothetical protein